MSCNTVMHRGGYRLTRHLIIRVFTVCREPGFTQSTGICWSADLRQLEELMCSYSTLVPSKKQLNLHKVSDSRSLWRPRQFILQFLKSEQSSQHCTKLFGLDPDVSRVLLHFSQIMIIIYFTASTSQIQKGILNNCVFFVVVCYRNKHVNVTYVV